MPVQVKFDPDNRIIVVESTGKILKTDASKSVSAIIDLSKSTGVKSVLVDATGMTDVFDIVSMIEFAEEHALEMQQFRVAFVSSAAVKKRLEFAETALVNRAWKAQVFPSRDEAILWLQDRT